MVAGVVGAEVANKENEAAAAAPEDAAQVRLPPCAPALAAGKPATDRASVLAPAAPPLPPAAPPRVTASPFSPAGQDAGHTPGVAAWAPAPGGVGANAGSWAPGQAQPRARSAFCGAAPLAPDGLPLVPVRDGACARMPPSPFSSTEADAAPAFGGGRPPAASTAVPIPPTAGHAARAGVLPGLGLGFGIPSLGDWQPSQVEWAGVGSGGAGSLSRAGSARAERQPSLQDWFQMPAGESRASSMDCPLPPMPEDGAAAPNSEDERGSGSGAGSPQFRLMLSPPSRFGRSCLSGSPGSPGGGSPRAFGAPRGATPRHHWGIASPARHPGALLQGAHAPRVGVSGFAPVGGALLHAAGGEAAPGALVPALETDVASPLSPARLALRRALAARGSAGSSGSAGVPDAASGVARSPGASPQLPPPPRASAGAASARNPPGTPTRSDRPLEGPVGLPRARRGAQPARRSLDLSPERRAGGAGLGVGSEAGSGSRPGTPKRCRSMDCDEVALAEAFSALRSKSPRLGQHYGRPLLSALETGLAG